jgi:hypothetical protein
MGRLIPLFALGSFAASMAAADDAPTPEITSFPVPNVAFAPMNDDVLAATMNFVVFGLGGGSTPLWAAPYTPDEVKALRQVPLKNLQLASLRYTIFTEAAARSSCPPPR